MPVPAGPPAARAAAALDSLRGAPILDFFPALCRMAPEIASLHFATYRRRPSLGDRLRAMLTPEDDALQGAAERVSAAGVAYWDAVLSVALARGTMRDEFAEASLLHDFHLPERSFDLSSEQILNNGIAGLLPALAASEGLLVRSHLRLSSGGTAHLPMLDLACPCLPANARAIRRMVALAGVGEGLLVRSGHSYHFYGTHPVPEERWLRFMAAALLFAPITDSRYVAHRLLDGECRLKIVDSGDGMVPVIEDTFGDAV
ncbi:MAG TPA: hypothetical protein VL523_09915 [Terriglobia bacterium]|nr:hypothetical protein [Terriglobia bacterium]